MDSWKSFFVYILNWKTPDLSTLIHILLNIRIPWSFRISRIYTHSFITQLLEKWPFLISWLAVNSSWKTRWLSVAKVRSIYGCASFPEKMNIPECFDRWVFNMCQTISTPVCGLPELSQTDQIDWKLFKIKPKISKHIRFHQNSKLLQSFDNHFFSLFLSIHH